jgi:hypothetical protein
MKAEDYVHRHSLVAIVKAASFTIAEFRDRLIPGRARLRSKTQPSVIAGLEPSSFAPPSIALVVISAVADDCRRPCFAAVVILCRPWWSLVALPWR